MEGKILFDITNLRFERFNKINVSQEFYWLSNKDEERAPFYDDIFKKQYGESDTRFIPSSVFAYAFVQLENQDRKLIVETEMLFEEKLFERQQSIEALLSSLWFVKDNSIGLFSTIGIIPAKRIVARLSKTIGFWNARGEKHNTSFSLDEISEGIKFLDLFARKTSLLPKSASKMIIPGEFDQHGQPHKQYLQRTEADINYNNQTPLDIAYTFLIIARNQNVLIYKIAYYMATLESLFTTNSTEITTRMSYRVAYYIGTSNEEKKEIFDAIGDAYNVRSKFIHGQKFEKDKQITKEVLCKMSSQIDEFVRRIFRKILLKDYDVFTIYLKDDRNTFLNDLVFDVEFNHQSALTNLAEYNARQTKKK